MKNAVWFVAGLALGGGSLAAAAPGDLIYQDHKAEVKITAAQAACFADCAIAAGAWDGARTDLVSACAHRTGSGFAANAIGLKTVAPGAIPVGAGEVRVVGRVE